MPESCPTFCLFKRKGRSCNYYVQFKDPATGKYLPYRSTGCSDKTAALLTVAGWLKDGIPEPIAPKARKPATKKRRPVVEVVQAESILKAARKAELTPGEAEKIVEALNDRKLVNVQIQRPGPADQDFIGFLSNFWDYKISPYIRDKLAHQQRIGIRYCKEMYDDVLRHWKPCFPGRSLASITKADMRAFSTALVEKGLSGTTMNRIMLVGTIAVSWAYENDIIGINPAEGLRRYSAQSAKRGILSEDELSLLFSKGRWPEDDRARVAALLSVTTGMRQGEIRAIKLSDIECGTLRVYAWKDSEHRRAEPKNGETRTVPLLPQVKEALLELARENPHGQDGYVFYGLHPDEPSRPEPIISGLDAALSSIGISHEERLSRHVDFHSFRHYFTTHISRTVESGALKTVTGHKTDSMFSLYSSHKTARDMLKVADAVASTFGSIVDTVERPSRKDEAS